MAAAAKKSPTTTSATTTSATTASAATASSASAEDHFPTWPQDISNVVLYFAADGANDPDDVNDDGYVLVKIDNWPGSGDDDLDNSLDTIMDYLLAQGVIDEVRFPWRGNQGRRSGEEAFFADDGSNSGIGGGCNPNGCLSIRQ